MDSIIKKVRWTVEKALLFAFFILGIVCGAIFVLTAHNCCCDQHGAHCEPCIPACVDCEARLSKLERVVFRQGTEAPE